ncbi:MAG: murein biosynthesis integral membrane protein MurJ, partial [Planctomycetota bacterium]
MAERGFLGSARLIGACTMSSRVLGMVRDILCASFFGASAQWDAFVIAFIIPNLFRRLFGEGALTAAFVPVFVDRLRNQGKPAATRLLRALTSALSLVLLSIVLVGMVATLVVPHLTTDEKLLSICEMLRVMLPYLFFICVAAILGGALNSLDHFFAPAFAPVILNAIWIAAIVVIAADIQIIVWAVLIGGAVELSMQVYPLLRRGVNPLPRFDAQERGLHEIYRLFIPVVFGLALVQINEVVDNIIAELCVPGDGAVSVLYYANRLMQVPLAVIGTALATAAFPKFSAQVANKDPTGFAESIGKALRACLFVAVPATVGLCILAVPTIRLLFEYGKFDAAATGRTHLVLVLFALGICAYSANLILVRGFYARKEMKTPVRVAALMVFANVVLNLILVWPLREAGLALSTAVTGTATCFILYALLR